MAYDQFVELDVWKKSYKLCVRVLTTIQDQEKGVLAGEIIECALGIPGDIANGAVRDSKMDFIRALYDAKSGVARLQTLLMVAADSGLFERKIQEKFNSELQDLGNDIYVFIKTMRKKY